MKQKRIQDSVAGFRYYSGRVLWYGCMCIILAATDMKGIVPIVCEALSYMTNMRSHVVQVSLTVALVVA